MSMNLTHRSSSWGPRRAYHVIDVEPNGRQGVLAEDVATGTQRFFRYGDPELNIDPTDEEYFACVNVKAEED